MAVTGTQTVGDICTAALRRAGVAPIGQDPHADETDEAIGELNRMLKGWQATGALWTRDAQSVTLIAATASYALTAPARPLAILSANYKDANGLELPMWPMTRDDYDALPDKTVSGIPTQFHYDRAREQGTLYIWPVPASVTTETVELVIEAEIEDVTAVGETIDVPAEWWDAVVQNLAVRLRQTFQMQPDMVAAAMAADALATARAMGMPEPVSLGWGDA